MLFRSTMRSAEAALASRSTHSFSFLGIWTNLIWRLPTRPFTSSRYFFILSFTLAFVAAIDLISYNLGVAVYDHIFSPCCSYEVQSCDQGFVFCLIIGCMKFESDHALDPIFFWGDAYYANPSCLPIGRSVHVNIPLGNLFCHLAVHESELGDEISHNLSLYSCSWTVLYVEFT